VACLTIGQDFSDRHVQFAAGDQFSLGKSRRGCGPKRSWLITPDELPNPDDPAISCSVDGEKVQDADTSDQIFDIPPLVADVAWVPVLLPGGVNFTGTPAGAGIVRQPPTFLAKGQVAESGTEVIGCIQNRCA
jgi:2,4-didehydro-3-deoxy-L-rhamnonate hydrolase